MKKNVSKKSASIKKSRLAAASLLLIAQQLLAQKNGAGAPLTQELPVDKLPVDKLSEKLTADSQSAPADHPELAEAVQELPLQIPDELQTALLDADFAVEFAQASVTPADVASPVSAEAIVSAEAGADVGTATGQVAPTDQVGGANVGAPLEFGGFGGVIAGIAGAAAFALAKSPSGSVAPTQAPTSAPTAAPTEAPVLPAAVVETLAAKGILSGSKVYYDFDGNGEYTTGEPFAVTASNGKAFIELNAAQKAQVESGLNDLGKTLKVIVSGGTDVTNGTVFTGSLSSVASTDTAVVAKVNVFSTMKASGMSDAVLRELMGGRDLDSLTADDFNSPTAGLESLALKLWDLVSANVGADADSTEAAIKALSNVLEALDTAGGDLNALLGAGGLSAEDLDSLVVAAVEKAMELYDLGYTADELDDAMSEFAEGLEVEGFADGVVTDDERNALEESAVKQSNNAPALSGTVATLSAGTEDTAYTVTAADLLSGYSDVEGSTLSVTGLVATNASVVDNEDGTFTITPSANYNGAVDLSYGVFDGTATTAATQSITLTAVNDAAVLSSAVVALDETDAALTTGGALSITDVDSAQTFVAQTNVAGSNGVFNITSAGVWSYTANSAFDSLNEGDSLSDTFTVVAADGTETSVQVTLNGSNDAAILSGTVATLGAGTEDTAYTVSAEDLLSGYSDVDGSTLSVTGLSATNASVVDNEDGTFTITPSANYNGAVTLSYGVFDGTATTVATQSITLTAVNDAPQLTTDLVLNSGYEDTAYTLSEADLLSAYSDAEGQDLTITGLSSSNASVIDNNNGTYTIIPVANFTGEVVLEFGVFDGLLTTAATHSFDVLAVDDSELSTLVLTASQVTDLADVDFSFEAGTDITVMGTSFLNAGSGYFDGLLTSSTNVIELDDSYLANLAADTDEAAVFAANAINAHISAISTSGAETLIDALSASDLSYALAGLNFDSAQQITLLDAMNVTTLEEADFQSLNTFLGTADVSASLSLANVQSDYVDTDALIDALAGLQADLLVIGVDQILITDDLANALADANIEFLQSIAKGGSGMELDLEAVSDDESGNAYINASLQDLADVGVDEVSASDGVQKIEIALRDANETGTLFTLDDLPNFNVEDGFVVSLAVDEDDLAALLASDDGAVNFAQIAASGITEINYTGDTVHDGLEATLTSSGLTLSSQALSVAEVELLGLGDEPADPLALFYKA